jgi:hypothetical protein
MEKALAPSDRLGIPYFEGMVQAHSRFYRYGRVVAKLVRSGCS